MFRGYDFHTKLYLESGFFLLKYFNMVKTETSLERKFMAYL